VGLRGLLPGELLRGFLRACVGSLERSRLEQENGELRERLERIERALGVGQESEQ